MARKIISQTPTNASVVHAELIRIKNRDTELGFRAQKALDALQLSGDEKVGVSILLRDLHFHKIIDLLPTNAKDVKTILQGYNVTVSQENCKKIADTVAEAV